MPPQAAAVVPAPVAAADTWVGRPPARFAAGTVPPPVSERPLPSLFGVVARIRRQTVERMLAPLPVAAPDDPDDVETIVVDLDDDEILLGEADILMAD